MTFVEAVKEIQDWATANGATVSITRARGIDGGDGKVWDSFIVHTDGAAPGAVSQAKPEAVEVIRNTPGEFHVEVG